MVLLLAKPLDGLLFEMLQRRGISSYVPRMVLGNVHECQSATYVRGRMPLVLKKESTGNIFAFSTGPFCIHISVSICCQVFKGENLDVVC